MIASLHAGPIHFESPVWLLLIPVCWTVIILISRKSIAGMGLSTRTVALGVRLAVILLLCAALAEPSFRRESKDVAVTVVLDTSESVPTAKQTEVDNFITSAATATERKDDRLGVVTAAKDAFVQALPTKLNKQLVRQHVGSLDATNLAAAVRLALAVMPKDAANRIVLATDGNETVGSLLQAAEVAKALNVPIDVLPLKYKYTNEVLIDRIAAPASAREGENVNLHVVLRSIQATTGRLTVMQNGDALDLDPSNPEFSAPIALKEGLNVLQIPVSGLRSGPQNFEAVFEPQGAGGRLVGDSILENNRALAVTFVSGEGRVLILSDNPDSLSYLVEALDAAKIRTEIRGSGQAPTTLTEMNAFDAIILSDQSADAYTQQQQEELRQYVHDTGGGLVILGGPNSFGAGGWIGSPLEDAFPVQLDLPSKRQMPRGALALVIHSCEMPEGVFYGKKVCQAAVESLSRLDLAGIIEYSWNGSTTWVHPLNPVGDGTAIKRSINNLMFGDMPDFTPSVQLAYEGLKAANAGQKHVIMISDGDPAAPPSVLLDKFLDAKITISTVGVFPHGGTDTSKLKYISEYTKGRHYDVNTTQALASIPQIFIKEAQTIRRSLMWEGEPFSPTVVPGLSDSLRGITQVPPISGYIVTAEREGLALVSIKGKEGDPIMAQWQYGLGKVLAYTSDATTRWNPAWISWGNYKAFWEQNVRWTLRPGGSANVRVLTENKGDRTVITVEALDSKGERLNFANFKGRLALPDGQGSDVELKQVGPGRYQGSVATEKPGSYVLSMRYNAPDASVESGFIEGSVQAAVTRPFADEYRMMEDNTALLNQVAEMTGGRVLEWDSSQQDLWSRDKLKMPVSLQPIWLFVGALAVGLFVFDVGVRRVRIDIPLLTRRFLSLFGASKTTGTSQIGGLKAAKAAAQERIAKRVSQTSGSLSQAELEAQAKAAVKAASQVAKAKFEAPDDAIRKRPGQSVIMGGADATVSKQPPRQSSSTQSGTPSGSPPSSPTEGMSRLLKAKKKARDEMEDP